MKKLVYVANWGRNEEFAWSGTIPALYRELGKIYDIERFDVNVRVPLLLPLRFVEKAKIARLDRSYMKYYSRKFAKRNNHSETDLVLQFDEYSTYCWAHAYIFQDLSVGYLHSLFVQKPELIPYCGFNNLTKRYLEKREKEQAKFYQNASGVFTMGQWLADYLIEYQNVPAEKVHAVGGGINVNTSKIDYSFKTGNKFLFIGRDFLRKGGDLVVEAFQVLKKENPEIELYIAGPKRRPNCCKKEIPGIHFMGVQSSEQLEKLYNLCDVFCMPSRFEAYGLVIAEALTYGLPCVARDAFAMPEMVRNNENGYLITDDNISELAKAMIKALRNKEMQKNIRNNKERYIEQFSWERVAMRVAEIMQ